MTKVSLLALMLMGCATPAQSGDFLYAENEGDGRIVLSNVKCQKHPDLMVVRAITKYNEVAFTGCWHRESETDIEVLWDDGTRYSYELIDFRPTPHACGILLKERDPDAQILGCEPEEH